MCVLPQVRGAFFEVVSALCELTPGLVQTEAPRACPAVLLSIDDTDPVVLPPLWEAVLHVLSSIPVSVCECVCCIELHQPQCVTDHPTCVSDPGLLDAG